MKTETSDPQLFPVPIMTPSQRPLAKHVFAKVARTIAEGLAKWGGWPNGDDIDELTSNIVDAMGECAPLFDGYEMAKCLEDEHDWSIESQFVEELDCHYAISEALSELCEQWVKDHGIKRKFAVGDAVRVFLHGQPDRVKGTITKIHDSGLYSVDTDGSGRAYLKNWEDVTPEPK